jgi:hypothetical protein
MATNPSALSMDSLWQGADPFAKGPFGAAFTSPEVDRLQDLVSGAWAEQKSRVYRIEAFGSVSQAQYFSAAGAMTIGSPVLTITGYMFAGADIGKTVGIKGPGVGSPTSVFSTAPNVANDGVLVATILSVSDGLATLSVAATQTASNCECIVGHLIDTAFAAAVAQCGADFTVDGVAGVVRVPTGRYIAAASVICPNGTTIAGVDRDSSWVYVVKITNDAADVAKSNWLRGAGSGALNNLTQLSFVGTFFASSGSYNSQMKMINITGTKDSYVTWCRIVDNPSTALGYDGSENCEIAYNIILRPARLARPDAFGGTGAQTGGAGGSGIGIALAGTGGKSYRIHHNYIVGTLAAGMDTTSAGGVGRSGINLEAASGIPAHPTYIHDSFIIESNIISGFYNGIVDGCGVGSQIVNNKVSNCVHGIKVGSNGIAFGRMGRDAIISGNDVRDGFIWNTTYIPYGIVAWGRLASTTDDNAANLESGGRTRIINNVVTNIAGGYGIGLVAWGGGSPVNGPISSVSVENNLVTDCGLSGIRLVALLSNIAIRNNVLISNGRDSVAGNKAPIVCDTGTTWDRGWLAGNSYWDPESSPTQDATPTFNNAVLTGVFQTPGVLTLPAGTVADLPAASATYLGIRAIVNDATAAYTSANVGATVAGGGANTVPVFCNGTNWVIG